MKKSILLGFTVVVTALSARGHYVCYENRTIVNVGGDEYYMKYDGCMISRYSCSDIGMRRFGHYESDYKTREALRRCLRSKPRFVD